MGYSMANPTGPNRGMSPGVNDHHEPGPNCTEDCQPGLSEPTDPQAGAAEVVLPSILCEHDGHYSQGQSAHCKRRRQETAERVAAALAEAGLLVDPAGSLLIQSYAARAEDADAERDRFMALFNDAMSEARKAYTQRDAARAELARLQEPPSAEDRATQNAKDATYWEDRALAGEYRAKQAEADAATAYQRGMVAGARQVLAAAEKVWGDGAVLNRDGMNLLTAAREAVVRIEGGA